MMVKLMPFFTRLHVWLFRTLGAKYVGKTNAGGPILLLTTTGRHSKEKRTIALGYLDEGDNLYVVASNGGQHKEPDWSYNLRANQNAEVEHRNGKSETTVELLDGNEREQVWQRYIDAYPEYEQAEHWAKREFPLYRIPVGKSAE
jgi:deazaflavin-dependent oxidoreductase (nitroreductase family)